MNKTTKRVIPVAVLLCTLALTMSGNPKEPTQDQIAVLSSNSIEDKEESFEVAHENNSFSSVAISTDKKIVIPTVDEKTAKTMQAKIESRGTSKKMVVENFKVTAYDLSEEDCGKKPTHKYYGVTSTGYSLKGKDVRDRKIAVDPRVIPYGTKVYMEFPEEIRYIKTRDGETVDLNAVYTAVDTGGAIKGNRIDLYMGEDVNGDFYKKLVSKFGVRQVRVYRVE